MIIRIPFLCVLTLSILLPQTGHTMTLVSQNLAADGYTIDLKVPKGYKVEFLYSLETPRLISKGPENELLIGSNSNVIYRLAYPFSSIETLAELDSRTNSVVYRDGKIFSAQTSGLFSAPYSSSTSHLTTHDFTLETSLPSATGGHSSRTVTVGPDQQLYIGIGISGNCSDQYLDNSYPFEQRRGGVFLLDETGISPELLPYASGLRNPVGLAFHPDSKTLFATNAGPDNLGFDQPPEILAALEPGSYHGMPWFQFIDNQFTSGECASSTAPRPMEEASQPVALFAPRSTPLGIAFVSSNISDSNFKGNAIVAIHGSWAKPPGGNDASRRAPQLSMVIFNNQTPDKVVDLITGFQRDDGTRFARPTGVIVGADGNIYFTSDGGDVTGLFRLRPKKKPHPVNSAAASSYLLLL